MSEQSPVVRRRLSPEARRAQIIESAKAVWSRTGARRATIRDIADEAGVTENFVYQMFRSREEIFKLAVLDPLNASLKRLAEQIRAIGSDADFEQADEVCRRMHQAFLGEVSGMIPLMTAAHFADPVEGPEFYSGKLVPVIRGSILPLMQGLTGFAPRSVEIDLAVRAVMGAHFAIGLESVLEAEQVDVKRLADDLSTIFRQGFLRAKAGIRPIGASAESGRISRTMEALPQSAGIGETAPGARRIQLSRTDRISALNAAAREVFLIHGLTGARSRQLAEKAGITEAFMFRLVESKESLYERAVLEPLTAAFSGLATKVDHLARTSGESDFLPSLVGIALPFFIENGPMCVSALFSELGEGQKYLRQALSPHLRAIEAAIATRQQFADLAIDARTVRQAIFGAHWAISFDHERRPYRVNSARVVAILGGLLGHR